MKRSLLLGFAALTLALPAGAAPSKDAPSIAPHWGETAVDSLKARGIVTGYPGGAYRGDKAISRYEVVEMMNRLTRALEGDMDALAPKAENPGPPLKAGMDKLKVEVDALQHELNDLGGRTDEVR